LPAPGRFSTTIAGPLASPICLPRMRARISALPPGGNGTITRICLPLCARAGAPGSAKRRWSMRRQVKIANMTGKNLRGGGLLELGAQCMKNFSTTAPDRTRQTAPTDGPKQAGPNRQA
jgi:hypothetical protein